MSSNEELAAVIIANSVSSLAGFAAAELVSEPAEGLAAGNDFDVWKGHLEQRFMQLRAALVLEETELLTREVRWSKAAFESRGLPLDDLSRTLEVMRGVLEEKLPEPAAESAAAYLGQASAGLAEEIPKAADDATNEPTHRLALEYLKLVLEGEAEQAISRLVDELDQGAEMFDLYEQVLMPAQREVGRLWHAGELGIAEEQHCTRTTGRAMSVLTHRTARERSQQSTRGTVLAAATHGNAHQMPLRVLADFFEVTGWRSVLIGQSLPTKELADGIRAFEADLLLFSVTIAAHLPDLMATIEAIRECDLDPAPRILVGGRALDALPAVWQKIGADAYAPSARAALTEADRLFA